MTGRLEEFRDLVKEVVRSACRAALKEAGFIPDDYLMEVESDMDGGFFCQIIFALQKKITVGLTGVEKIGEHTARRKC